MRKLLFVLLITISTFIFADSRDETLQKMESITYDLSNKLCGTVYLSGNNQSIQAGIKAELNRFIKTFANLAASINYSYSWYNGFSQVDLLQAVKDNTDCKEKVLAVVFGSSLFMPPSDNGKTNLSYQDRLIQDQHPTNLVIERFEFRNFIGINESYVVAIAKNNSDVTAKHVTARFFALNGKEILGDPSINKLYKPRWLSIRAGQEQVIPIAPVSKYIYANYPNNSNAKLLSLSIESNLNLSEICSNSSTCHFSTDQIAIMSIVKYNSIFDESYIKPNVIFNVFLTDKQ
ncbi:MAG: hypothetical protein K2Y14_11480 [Burkholderiales bacterium]|nr:hypothetical protein [Burkholderiales bacterium]